jgi:hypothetical protein
MSFKVTGKIKKVLDKQEGTSKQGKEWSKQSFVVSNNDGYEGKEVIYCFEIFGGEKVKKFNDFNKVGDNVDVNFNISTNEYEGRYYTSLSAFSVFKSESKVETPAPHFETISADELNNDDLGDLPF